MLHRTLLEFRRYRYLKLSSCIVALALIAYSASLFVTPTNDAQVPPPYGATWTGYGLGTVGAFLILWLLWLGVRKRQYRNASGTLQGWTSAHVYLGAALLLIGSLHTGFHFGWNVHTLAYVLMVAVIVSGFYGVYAYLRFPRHMTENMAEDSLDTVLKKIIDLDRDARRVALQLPDEINQLVDTAATTTLIGGNVWQQLRRKPRRCPTDVALAAIERLGKGYKGETGIANHELYAIMLRRRTLVARARKDIRLRGALSLWLYFHVPLSLGLLAALMAHVVSVFFYW